MQPAPVTIPPYIKNVGIIDRSRADDKNKTLDAIHRAVSLESGDLQKEGADAGTRGLADELTKNNRFINVKVINTDLRSFGAGVFPSQLQWDVVEKICRENNTDALFALELFDTESKISYAASPASINTGIANIPAIEHLANMSTLVKTGWRIYDPSSKNILDEYVLSRTINFSGRGINPVVAASALIGKKEAVKQVSTDAGQTYASRILPYWIRVSRDYFVRGNANFTIATRMARTGNWDGAAQLWKKETTNPNGKIAGRACYNMAIISEINGDLDGAIQWAQKSYENYGVRLALIYVKVLNHRKADNEILKSQDAVTSNE